MHTRRDCSARYAPRLIRFGAVQVQWAAAQTWAFLSRLEFSSLGRCSGSRLLPWFPVQSLLPEAVHILACRAWARASNVWGHQLFRWLDRQFQPIPPQPVRPLHERSLLAAIAL